MTDIDLHVANGHCGHCTQRIAQLEGECRSLMEELLQLRELFCLVSQRHASAA
jgi:hypothetical protein